MKKDFTPPDGRKRMTAEQWEIVREKWESDPREGHSWLIEEMGLGVSLQAIRKKAAIEGWAKTLTLEGLRRKAFSMADEKVHEKVHGLTFYEASIDIRAQVIEKHREDWEAFRNVFPLERLSGDIDEAKKAETVARVYAAMHAGERKAYALDEQQGEAKGAEVNISALEAVFNTAVLNIEKQKAKMLARGD